MWLVLEQFNEEPLLAHFAAFVCDVLLLLRFSRLFASSLTCDSEPHNGSSNDDHIYRKLAVISASHGLRARAVFGRARNAEWRTEPSSSSLSSSYGRSVVRKTDVGRVWRDSQRERYADETEKAGHQATAVAIRARFARLSGFSAGDAERIKRIGDKYCADLLAQHDMEVATVHSVRKANPGVRMSKLNSPEIAEVQGERTTLRANLKESLIAALGPRGFTKLDSYSVHMYDNATKIEVSKPAAHK